MALVLGLDDKLARQAEQPLALELVVDETVDDLLDGVLLEVGLHEAVSLRRMRMRL